MRTYERITIEAYGRLREKKDSDPRDAWRVAREDFTPTEKGCPESTFIGLYNCERLKGVKCKEQCKTRGIRNTAYAVALADIYVKKEATPETDDKEVWELMRKKVRKEHKIKNPAMHDNQQIVVVKILYKRGFLK